MAAMQKTEIQLLPNKYIVKKMKFKSAALHDSGVDITFLPVGLLG